MKKFYKALLSIGLSILMCFGIVTIERSATHEVVLTDAAEGSYYSSVTASSGTQLLGQLHDLITRTHTKYTSYDDCKTPATVMKTDPGTASNMVRDFYTQEDISSTWNGNAAGTWNREHVWAQSLSNNLWGTSGGGSDMHHLRPSEVRLNGTRGNHTFGVANGGTPAYYKDTNGNNKYIGGYVSGDTFEPLDKVKGDVARIILYTYTHYNTYTNGVFGGYATTNGSGSAKFGSLTFTMIMSPSSESEAIKLLLEWNAADKVDDIERTRNEAVYSLQGNRNPFIDHPEYADAIWGNGSVTPNPGGDTTPTLTGLTMSASSLSLNVGQSSTLSVTATPSTASNAVTWSSSNQSVATVSGGKVTAVGAGTATITATSTVNPSINATATVTVTSSATPTGSATIDIHSFASLSGSYAFQTWSSGGIQGMAYIYGAQTSKMQFNNNKDYYYLASTSATPQPIQSVTLKLTEGSKSWKLLTSSSAYTEVKPKPTNGTDHGAKTATTSGVTWTLSGKDTYFALTYEDTGVCYVDSIIVTYGSSSSGGDTSDTLMGLAITPASVSLEVGQSQTLSVTATPSTASNAVTWSSSNASVATVSDGKVTAVGQGSATITATSTVNSSIMATAQVTVTKTGSTEPPTPPVTPSGKTTIDIDSFDLTAGYGFKTWSADGVSGIAYIYGGNPNYDTDPLESMQFNNNNNKQYAYYLASTTAAPAPIKSVTVKSTAASEGKEWKLLTGSTAYEEVAGKPDNGTDHGTKAVTADGVTWTLSGEDTFFALTYESTGVCFIDSIIIEYGDTGSGGEQVSAQVAAFRSAVASIVTSGPLAQRLASINKAITAYKALTNTERTENASYVAQLQAAIDDYNETVRAYNEDAQKANGALCGGK